MKRVGILLVGLFAFAFSNEVEAQNVLDGVYIKQHATSRRVIPYTHLREADVMWSRRVWRMLDMREKINHPLYFPIIEINDRKSMIQVTRSVAQEGVVTAFSPFDDEFKLPLSVTEIENIGVSETTVEIEDPETFEITEKTIKNDFNPANVKRYRLKEDYFFDKQKSELDVRTIGLCPVLEKYDEAGEYKGDSDMFWVYYPEIRMVYANAEVYNTSNDSERRTIEDIFWSRQFATYIYKKNNVYDRYIAEYKEGLDALLEGQRIHEEIRDWEQDLWEY
jgi:gliding motility associated protien GldN